MSTEPFHAIQPEIAEECMLLIEAASKMGDFPLGRIVITPEAKLNLHPAFVSVCLFRHSLSDWGEVDDEDWHTNDKAREAGARILSAYKAPNGERLWIITEHNRSVTTCLLPDEY